MKALRFKIEGKFAHFRRFYTNSSSLTYSIPPPPTVAGILGAALGLSSEEYPEVFSDAEYSIRPMTHWRTIMQTINLLKVTTPAGLNGSEGHTQIPTQFLAPQQFDKRIIFEITIMHPDEDFIKRLERATKMPEYLPYLGVAYCPGWFVDAQIIEGNILDTYEGEVLGAIRESNIENIEIKEGQRILRDRYPLRIDTHRHLVEADDLLLDESGNSIKGKFNRVFLTDDGGYALI